MQTRADGDFHVYAIMDVATGLIHGMEFSPSGSEGLSEFEARRLLNSAEAKAGAKPKYLFVNAEQQHSPTKRAAASLGIKIRPEAGSCLDRITEEARVGFAAHVGRGQSR